MNKPPTLIEATVSVTDTNFRRAGVEKIELELDDNGVVFSVMYKGQTYYRSRDGEGLRWCSGQSTAEFVGADGVIWLNEARTELLED